MTAETFRYDHEDHGIAVYGAMPVMELCALTTMWTEEYGYDIMDVTIAHKPGAVMVLTSKADSILWREKLFKEPLLGLPVGLRTQAWLETEHIGMSAVTIWQCLSGLKYPGRAPHNEGSLPYDPADFHRCEYLLKLIPEWYERLDEVGSAYPDWKPFVDAWGELQDLWYGDEGEEPKDSFPKLYARMTELHDDLRSRLRAERGMKEKKASDSTSDKE